MVTIVEARQSQKPKEQLKQKLYVKPVKRRGGGSSSYNRNVDKERARIDDLNRQLRESGLPIESRSGESIISKQQRLQESQRQAAEQARKRQEAAQQAEVKRQQEIQRRQQENIQRTEAALEQRSEGRDSRRGIDRESSRISRLRDEIVRSGGQGKRIFSTDVKTGDKLQIDTVKKGGSRVVDVTNITTGEKTTRTYEVPRGGGSSVLSGGLIFKETKSKKQTGDILTNETKKDSKDEIKTGTFTIAPERTFWQRIKDLPAKLSEKITGEKPKETFARVTDSGRDVSEDLTVGKAAVDAGGLVLAGGGSILEGGKAIKVLAGAGAEKITEKVLPEGIDVNQKATKDKEFTVFTPQFGTVTQEAPTGVVTSTITQKGREARTVKILTPELVGEGVEMGTGLAIGLVTPTKFLAPALILGGTQAALDERKTKEERLIGAAEAGLGTFIGSAALIKAARTPVTITKATRGATKPVTLEVQATKVIDDQPEVFSVFKRTTEVRPPTEVIKTTKGRILFGLPPKSAVKTKSKIITQFTPFPVKIKTGEVITVATKQTGKRGMTVSRIIQESKPTTRKGIAELKKVEKRLETELGRQGPVSILGPGEELTTTVGASRDIRVITKTPRTITDKPILDPTTSKVVAVSKSKKIADVEGAQVFLTEGAASAPTSRIVSKGEGVVVKLTGKESRGSMDISRAATGIGTKKITKEVSVISDLVSIPKAGKAKTSIVSTKSKTDVPSPLIISKQDKKVSVISEQKPIVKEKDVSTLGVTSDIKKDVTIIKTGTSGRERGSSSVGLIVEKQKPVSDIKFEKDAQKNIISSQLNTDSTQKQILVQKQKATSVSSSPTAPTKIKSDAERPKISSSPLSFKTDQGYIAQIKEKGKWKNVIDKALSSRDAEFLAKKATDNTLSASARLRETSKKITTVLKNTMLKQDYKFRNYRKSKGKKVKLDNQWVEHRQYRLDKPGETMSLKEFKKSAEFKKIVKEKSGFGGGGFDFEGISAIETMKNFADNTGPLVGPAMPRDRTPIPQDRNQQFFKGSNSKKKRKGNSWFS